MIIKCVTCQKELCVDRAQSIIMLDKNKTNLQNGQSSYNTTTILITEAFDENLESHDLYFTFINSLMPYIMNNYFVANSIILICYSDLNYNNNIRNKCSLTSCLCQLNLRLTQYMIYVHN